VQEGDDGEGNAGRDGVAGGADPPFRKLLQQRLQEVRNGRLAQPAQPQAGNGNAQLGGGDEAIGVVQGALGGGGARLALAGQLLDAGAAHTHQCKLGRHEEAVGQHQDDHADQAQNIDKPNGH
jgi:hypothetical protein